MIVDLEPLKRALGYDVEDSSDDALIAEVEGRASAWVEAQTTQHRFGEPAECVDVVNGSGTTKLFLGGHVDGEVSDGGVTVRELVAGTNEWLDFTDFLRTKDVLIRTDGLPWLRSSLYEITYPDGYETAPLDIQAVVIELVAAMLGDAESGGFSSETMGDYSYKTADAVGASLSQVSLDTINRYRRMRA